jgi:hypothetical protein
LGELVNNNYNNIRGNVGVCNSTQLSSQVINKEAVLVDLKLLSSGTIGAILGFLASQSSEFYRFSENLETTKKIEMVQLGRDLVKTYYEDDNIYTKTRVLIKDCKKLYDEHISSDDISRYYGFFDDVGFYYRKGVIDLDFINQFFAVYIIQAYDYGVLNNLFSKNSGEQHPIYAEFQNFANELKKNKKYINSSEEFRKLCQNQ